MLNLIGQHSSFEYMIFWMNPSGLENTRMYFKSLADARKSGATTKVAFAL